MIEPKLRQIVRSAALALWVALSVTSRATADPLDACLENLRRGPVSFRGYFCLGAPGIPERSAEVARILRARLRTHPEDPRARLYYALMRFYAFPDDESRLALRQDFYAPVEQFRRTGDLESLFFSLIARLEFRCLSSPEGCGDAVEDVREAQSIARASSQPVLLRVAAIAEIRWNLSNSHLGPARRAERELLDPLGGPPPAWLAVLELDSRAWLAEALDDYPRARDLFRRLAEASTPGTVREAAGYSALADVTSVLYFQGLVSHAEALETSRRALVLTERVGLRTYNNAQSGSESAQQRLGILEGRNPATLARLEREGTSPVLVEFLSLGSPEERRRAVALVTASDFMPSGPFPDALRKHTLTQYLLVRSHAFLRDGRREEGRSDARRALALAEEDLGEEADPQIRMLYESRWASGYKSIASTLLDSTPSPDETDIAASLEAMEGLRARTLLETLLSRTRQPARAPEKSILQAVQEALTPSEALVSFEQWRANPRVRMPYVNGSSWAVVVTRARTFAVRIPDPEVLEPAIRAWNGLVQQRDPQVAEGSQRLYAQLLQPILSQLPADIHQLVLVPDGPLHRLAFDALSPTGAAPYLANHYAVSIVPSAEIWLQLRARGSGRAGPALALASGPNDLALEHAVTRGEVDPQLLRPLARARDEAREATETFGSGSLLLEEGGATVDALRKLDLASPVLVHVAAHAVSDEHHPDESFLLLSPGTSPSGKLRVADISSFDWSGKTIVLSACETSAGAVRIGEGVLSLARGFFAGGASAVVGTLGKVRDDEQYALFHEFYSELRRGLTVGEALSLAKRTLIARGAPPAAWANVILLGNADVRPHAPERWPDRFAWRWATLGAGMLLLVGALLFVRRRQRNAG
jgi:CHAT domain-containing protein